MSSNDYILLGSLIGVLVFLLGYWIGRREQKTPRGIPAENPPPMPAAPPLCHPDRPGGNGSRDEATQQSWAEQQKHIRDPQ